MVTPARRVIRRLESKAGQRSDLILKLYERVPDIMAKLIAGLGEQSEPEQLASFEKELTDQLAVLLKDFIMVGLSSPARVYAEETYRAELKPVIELVEFMRSFASTKEGKKS